MIPFNAEMSELAEKALASLNPDVEGLIITRGLVIAEILQQDHSHRGVIAVGMGRSGELTPWEVIGLIAPIHVRATGLLSDAMWGMDDENP